MHSSSTSSGPGSDFALGAAGEGGTRPLPVESHLGALGLRLLRMSSLHALGTRTRGSSGSAAADAAHLVPGLSISAAANAAAAASALKSAGERAIPVNRSDAQTDPQAASRALAKSRSLRRLERDIAEGAGSMKALKRRARARERAEVHRGSQRGTSGALTERRSAEEHFGRSAANQAAEEAAELASLSPATLGPPKRARESTAQKQRRRQRRRLKRSGQPHGPDDLDEQLRQDAALSAFVGCDQPPYTGARRVSSTGPTATGTCGCSALRMRALRNLAALALSMASRELLAPRGRTLSSLPHAARKSKEGAFRSTLSRFDLLLLLLLHRLQLCQLKPCLIA